MHAIRHRFARLSLLATVAVAACATAATSGTTSAPATAGSAHAPRVGTLKDAYRDAFMVGTSVGAGIASGRDTGSARLTLEQFNTITVENALKAGSVNPQPGVWTWEQGDAFVDFGQRHNMFIVGHTLVWHNQTPAWFFTDSNGAARPQAEMVERLRSHIQTVASRYAGRIHAWDVVNEVVDNDGGYRVNTAWVKAFNGDGDSLVRSAFRFAAQYAPNTELYYNDFNEWRPTKRDGIVRMVRMLQSHGIRIDGIGMQAHWGLNYPSLEHIAATIDSFAATGLKVMITELDVDVLPLTKEGQIIGQGMSDPQFQLEEFKTFFDPYRDTLPTAVQEELARRYADIFRVFYEKRDKIARVTFWGTHDGLSWKNGYPIPNRRNYPMLFDRNRQPKLAWDSVMAIPRRGR